MKLNSFFKECGEKEVFKMLSIYIVSSWVLIQVLSVVYQPLGLPEKSVTVLIIILLAAFPVYVFFIWKFRLAPLEKANELSVKGKLKQSKFQKVYFSFLGIILIFVIAAVSLIAKNAFYSTQELASLAELEFSGNIGILNFGNNTGKPEFDIVGKMSADWISHGITENQLGQVVSPDIVNDYIRIIKASDTKINSQSVLTEYFKPGKVITGNFYLSDSNLLFQSSITDGTLNKTLISFKPIQCESSNPLDCIEAVKQMVLGYLSTEEKGKLPLQEIPPKYNAYRYLLDATANYNNQDLYIELLEKAIAEDTNYFEPKLLRVVYYYNHGAYAKADSLRLRITRNSQSNKRQVNLLNHYEALFNGNSRQVYSTLKKEYNFSPFNLQTSASLMVVALQYVNRPKDVDTIFTKISMTQMDVANCTFCQHRTYIQGLSYLELKKYDETILLLKDLVLEVNALYLKRPLIAAYIRANKQKELDAFLEVQKIEMTPNDLADAYLFIGKEYLLKNDAERAKHYYSKIASINEEEVKADAMIEAAYMQKDFVKAQEYLRKQTPASPEDSELMARRAVILAKNKNQDEADRILQHLFSMNRQYSYGSVDYALAQYYAVVGDHKNALKHLLLSIADGNSYTIGNYQNDPHFSRYFDMPEFNKIMAYWH